MAASQPRLHCSLYRFLLRSVRAFRSDGLPLTGVVGLDTVVPSLAPARLLREEFRAGSAANGLTEAFHAMRTLPKQAGVLRGAEEQTREAQHSAAGPWSTDRALSAAVDAMWLLHDLHHQQLSQQLLLDEEIEEHQRACQATKDEAADVLTAMAEQVRGEAAALFDDATGTSQSLPDTRERAKQQLAAISKVMFATAPFKFKNEPVEWVYDGLAPLLLPDVLVRHKGIPFTLAVVYSVLAQRLGVATSLVCARDAQAPSSLEGPSHLHDLPPEVAAKQAGRTIASAPSPNTWLVRAESPVLQQLPVYVDVASRGALLDSSACQERYPTMQPSVSTLGDRAALAVWCELLRTAVLAHQRRGESDAVAHYMFQLLALEPRAPEWQHAMSASAIAS